ncbi:MAG: isochorismatase family protein [Verrucomicrobiota bacterium JB022]|nr:isochorismatase family protein [Verrucomicrobiota bacterium JB022]
MIEDTPEQPRVALLLLDLQDGFLKAIPNRDEVVQRCLFAARAAKLLDIPVLATEQAPEKLGATLPELLECVDDDCVFAKTAFSAFGADGLEETLEDLGVEVLFVAGIETPICVYQTVVDALRREIDVTLLTDAIGARRAQDARDVCDLLSRIEGVSLLPSETVFYSLLHSAEHPQFRAFTKLVKG